jgi:hypothetical protein
METFSRTRNRMAERRVAFGRKTEDPSANPVAGPDFPAYDFLIEKYENKNPSETLINIASRPVLIEKITQVAKSGLLHHPQIHIRPEPRQMASLREIFAVLATFPREIIGR